MVYTLMLKLGRLLAPPFDIMYSPFLDIRSCLPSTVDLYAVLRKDSQRASLNTENSKSPTAEALILTL